MNILQPNKDVKTTCNRFCNNFLEDFSKSHHSVFEPDNLLTPAELIQACTTMGWRPVCKLDIEGGAEEEKRTFREELEYLRYLSASIYFPPFDQIPLIYGLENLVFTEKLIPFYRVHLSINEPLVRDVKRSNEIYESAKKEAVNKPELEQVLYMFRGRQYWLTRYKLSDKLSYPKDKTFIQWQSFLKFSKKLNRDSTIIPLYADFQVFSFYLAIILKAPLVDITTFEEINCLSMLIKQIANALSSTYTIDFMNNSVDIPVERETIKHNDGTTWSSKTMHTPKWYSDEFLKAAMEELKTTAKDNSEDALPIPKWLLNYKKDDYRLRRALATMRKYKGDRTYKEIYQQEYNQKAKADFIDRLEGIIKEFDLSIETVNKYIDFLFKYLSKLTTKQKLNRFETYFYGCLMQNTKFLIGLPIITPWQQSTAKAFKKHQRSKLKGKAVCINCGRVFDDNHPYKLTLYCKNTECQKYRAKLRTTKRRADNKSRKLTNRKCKKCNTTFKIESLTRPEAYCLRCRGNKKELYAWKMKQSRETAKDKLNKIEKKTMRKWTTKDR